MNTVIGITLIIAAMFTAISLIHEICSIIRNERTTKTVKKIIEQAGEKEVRAKNENGMWTTFKVGEEQKDEIHH